MQRRFVNVEKGIGPDGRVAVVRFDRGDNINALSHQAMRELRDVPRDFEDDLDTSVVILTGSAKAFSAGFDLKDPESRAREDLPIGELELAFLGQHQRGADGELLADRGDAKARPRVDRYAQFDAGESIALAEFDLAAPHDGCDGARRAGPGVTGEQRVDATFEGDGSDRF